MGPLAEDLLVLAVLAENAGVQSARRMPYVLRGAELIQLCIDGRVTVTDGLITVVEAKETGRPDLDTALAAAAQRGQQLSADVWVREARDQIVHGYLRQLQDAGVLRRRLLSLPASLGMSPRYRAADPAQAGQIRDRVDAAVENPESATATGAGTTADHHSRSGCVSAPPVSGNVCPVGHTRYDRSASPNDVVVAPLPSSARRLSTRSYWPDAALLDGRDQRRGPRNGTSVTLVPPAPQSVCSGSAGTE